MRLPKRPSGYWRLKHCTKYYAQAMYWTALRRGCTDPALMDLYVRFSREWAALARKTYQGMIHS